MTRQLLRPTSSRLSVVFTCSAGMGLAITHFTLPAHGQSVERHILFTHDGSIKAASIPALHDGVFSGLGYRPDWSLVVYAGELGAATDTPPRIIAAPGDPVPNRPGSFFNHMDWFSRP